jgi:hypothetical protein
MSTRYRFVGNEDGFHSWNFEVTNTIAKRGYKDHNGVSQGWWEWFYLSGRIKSRVYFRDDKYHGPVLKLYDLEGSPIQSVEMYAYGEREGCYSYDTNGNIPRRPEEKRTRKRRRPDYDAHAPRRRDVRYRGSIHREEVDKLRADAVATIPEEAGEVVVLTESTRWADIEDEDELDEI